MSVPPESLTALSLVLPTFPCEAATFPLSENIYDTDHNVAWLANVNVNGVMTWSDAKARAADLDFADHVNAHDNWRLHLEYELSPGPRPIGRRSNID